MGGSSFGFWGFASSLRPSRAAARRAWARVTSVLIFSRSGVLSRRRVGDDGWNMDSYRKNGRNILTFVGSFIALETRICLEFYLGTNLRV